MTIPVFTAGTVLTAAELNTALTDAAALPMTQPNTWADAQTFAAGLVAQGNVLTLESLASTTTAGGITATAAQIAGGYLADGAIQTAAFTVTTDTAANILAAMPAAAVVGSSFKWRFINNDQSSTGYAGTLAGGTGVTVGTILPNPAVGQGNWEDYIFTFTAVGSSPTLTIEAVGGSSLGLL